MIETGEKSKTQLKASDDSFNVRVDTLIEDLIKTNIDDTVENKCKTCQKTIKDDIDNNNILVGDDFYHSDCFKCDHCSERLLGKFYVVGENKSCEDHQKVGLGKCAQCGDYLSGSSVLVEGASYHPECFLCSDCQGPIIGQFYSLEAGGWRCADCWRLAQPRCTACGLPILDQLVTALDCAWHSACFTCSLCSSRLDGGQFMEDEDNGVICRECFIDVKAPWCSRCEKVIISEPGKRTTVITCEDKKYHYQCYTCKKCGLNLNGKEVYLDEEEIVCKHCVV